MRKGWSFAMRAAALAAIAGLGVAGCGSDDAGDDDGAAGQSGKRIVKVGVLYPLTGPNAQQASETVHAVELAAEVANGQHPDIDLPQLENVKIELDIADTQSNPQVCSADIDRFKAEGMVAIVGGFGSSETLACSQQSERNGLPHVNGSASSPELVSRGLQYFFHVGPTDDLLAQTYVDWLQSIAAEHPVKRVAVIARNDQFGNDAIKVVQELFPPAGMEVVSTVTYDPTAADLTSQVQKVRGSDPDAVVAVPNTPDAIVLMRTMKNLNYTPPVILGFGGGFNDPTFFESVGNLADGIITRATWSPVLAAKQPLADAVAKLYESKYDIAMSENAARDFTAMRVTAEAIDAANSDDPTKVRDALREVTFGPNESIQAWRGLEFDERGQNTLADGVIQQWTGKDWVILHPESTGELVWPMPKLGSG